MFAVVKTGGKQYRVAAGDQLKVEKLAGEAGDIVELNEVLMVGETIGMPLVDGACVAAEIIEQGRARKVIAFKKRRRQNSRRTIGHRQEFSMIEITEILTDGKKPSKKAGSAAKAAKKADSGKAGGKSDAKASGKDAKPAGKDTDKVASGKGSKAEDDATAAKGSDAKSAKGSGDAGSAGGSAAAPLFTAPAGEPDDLTKIKGIGPVAKGQLAEQGITQFAQVAALTDAEIVIIDEAMPFSAEQISDWRAQAKDMVKG